MALKRYLHGKYVETVIPDAERAPEPTRFSFSTWIKEGALHRAELTNGDLISVLPHLNLAREIQGKTIPEQYTLADFSATLARGRLDAVQELRRECPACFGKGYTGDETAEIELCACCNGYGTVITPLAVEILRFLEWWKNPSPVITEVEIQKKNAQLALLAEAKKKKFAVQARLGMQLEGLQQQKQLEASAELAKKISKETAKIDAELEKKLKELEEE